MIKENDKGYFWLVVVILAVLFTVLFFVGRRAESAEYTWGKQLAYYEACVAFNDALTTGGSTYDYRLTVLWRTDNPTWMVFVHRFNNGQEMHNTSAGAVAVYADGGSSRVGGSSLSSGSSLGTFVDYDDFGYIENGAERRFQIYGYDSSDQIPVFNVNNYAHAGDHYYWPDLAFPVANPVCNTPDYCGLFVQVDAGAFTVHRFGAGDCFADLCDDAVYPFPTPTSTPGPTSTPTSTPGPTPTPTPTPGPTPTPTPVLYPMPSATVIPTTSDIDGTFTFDETTGMGTITVVLHEDQEMVDVPDEVYDMGSSTADSSVPLQGGGSSDNPTTITEDYLNASGNTLDTVSEGWYRPLVDGMLDMVMQHPFLAYFNDIEFVMVDQVCELTIEIYGGEFTIGFCDLEDELLLLRYVVIGIAGVYAVFIVLKGD